MKLPLVRSFPPLLQGLDFGASHGIHPVEAYHAAVLRALLDGKSQDMIKGLDSAKRARARRIVKEEKAG
jgi:hypothetical protein